MENWAISVLQYLLFFDFNVGDEEEIIGKHLEMVLYTSNCVFEQINIVVPMECTERLMLQIIINKIDMKKPVILILMEGSICSDVCHIIASHNSGSLELDVKTLPIFYGMLNGGKDSVYYD